MDVLQKSKKLQDIFKVFIYYIKKSSSSLAYSPKYLNYTGIVFLMLGLGKLFTILLLHLYIPTIIPRGDVQRNTSANFKKPTHIDSVNLTQILDGILYKSASIKINEEEEFIKEVKDYQLLGTLDGHPSFARAVIKLLDGKGPTQEYAIGNIIGIDRILWIGREYIIFRREEDKVKLKVGETTKEALEVHLQDKSLTDTTSSDGNTVYKVFSRQELNKIVKGNTAQIYKNASFGPMLDSNDKIIGYRLHSIGRGHIFSKLGAKSGDVVKKVNGYTLEDTERMFELWRTIGSADKIIIKLDRGGKPLTYHFKIKN